MLAPAVAQHVIETLTAGGVRLCGYEAAECARVEGCIPAFDPDLVAGLSPAEATSMCCLESRAALRAGYSRRYS